MIIFLHNIQVYSFYKLYKFLRKEDVSMIFKSGKANAGCWSFGPVLGLCAGYGNKKGW